MEREYCMDNKIWSLLQKRTSRRALTKAALLAPVVGACSTAALWVQPWLAHAQHPEGVAIQHPLTQILVPRTEVFAVGVNTRLYHKFSFDGWSAWLPISPSDALSFSPDLTAAVVGQTIHVFVQDSAENNIVWLQSINGDWSHWTLLG